jgi:predicted lactoylglutathione lyase
MDLKLEVIVLPVSDVDRASSFYEAAGFRMDADHATNDDGNGWVLQEVRKRAPGR